MHVRQRDCSVGQKQPFIHCAAFPASDLREGRKPLDEGVRDKGSSPRQEQRSPISRSTKRKRSLISSPA